MTDRILEGRSAIVTGAGKGIGRAIAHCLAQHGARLLVNNRSHRGDGIPSATKVATEIRAAGGEAVANWLDIAAPGAADIMVKEALDAFGQLDIVVHNAAVAPQKRIASAALEEYRHTFEINFFAAVALTQAAWRPLRDSGSGRLIYIISNGGMYGGDGLSAYAASKGALYGFMRSAATEGLHHGIRANALAPFAASQMTEAHLPPALKEKLPAYAIGPAAAWLASASCNVNGRIYICGGGQLREGRVQETMTVHTEPEGQPVEAVAGAAGQLAALPADRQFDQAVAAFADFARDLR